MGEGIKANKLKSFFKLLIDKYNKIWESHKWGFLVLSIFLAIIALVLIIYPLCYDTIFNCYTDDVLQYYPYVVGFFNKVKAGELHLWDTSLIAGGSFYSGVYYIPLDIFLGFAFILSYIMPAEVAYSISNILRVVCGSMLIYYVFKRKGFSVKTSFLISVIFCIGGMTETFYIFPVYLGISFYVPLAMLIIDLIIHEDKRYLLLIPLFSVVIVLYDFYIAYMLFAFMCVYFIIEAHLSCEKFFLISKEFWISFLYFMLMIFLGVTMSAFMLLPSSLYIVNETGRASQISNDYLWLYGKLDSATGELKLSAKHYFAQWTNLFHPNAPHNLGLKGPGDYIREHASMYLTSGGAMYLIYFILVGGKKENRLKPWVILFNILYCIPLFAMIFTFNEWPYVRWFFIPYMINFYAMAMAMDKYDFKFGNNKYLKLLPMVFMGGGLATMLYVVIMHPDIYFHYPKGDGNFYPITIGTIVFISLFIILLIIGLILEAYKKDSRIIYRLIPFTIFAEAIFASIIAFSTIGSYGYLTNNKAMMELKDHLYTLGYNENDGYRINMYTSEAKRPSNTNVLLNNVNQSRFFQSFYNTPMKDYYSDVHGEGISGWSKVSMHGYTPFSAPMFNTKYVISSFDRRDVELPNSLYNKLDTIEYIAKSNNTKYRYNASFYELKDLPQFIVYDSFFDDIRTSRGNSFINDVALLNSAYIKKPATYETDDEKLIKIREKQKRNHDFIMSSGLEKVGYEDIRKNILDDPNVKLVIKDEPDYIRNNYYHYYFNADFNKIKGMDMIYIIPEYVTISDDSDLHIYFMEEDEDLKKHYYPFHYNVGYLEQYPFEPDEIHMRVKKDKNNKETRFYGVNYGVYFDFINRQNAYKNRFFSFDDSKIKLEFTNTDNKPKLVKTPYTYSDDWYLADNKYTTVNVNGGFLGVMVPAGEENVKIELEFIPDGLNKGLKISAVGCIMYLCVFTPVVYFWVKKRHKRKEA